MPTLPVLEPAPAPAPSSPPRWFWPVLAGALLVTGTAVSWAAIHAATRPQWVVYERTSEYQSVPVLLDQRTGVLCARHVCRREVDPQLATRAMREGRAALRDTTRDLTRAP